MFFFFFWGRHSHWFDLNAIHEKQIWFKKHKKQTSSGAPPNHVRNINTPQDILWVTWLFQLLKTFFPIPNKQHCLRPSPFLTSGLQSSSSQVWFSANITPQCCELPCKKQAYGVSYNVQSFVTRLRNLFFIISIFFMCNTNIGSFKWLQIYPELVWDCYKKAVIEKYRLDCEVNIEKLPIWAYNILINEGHYVWQTGWKWQRKK